ncbi:MAG: beta-phosphoglucomutase [Bacteroidetes bacterium]|jgi:beta-phosphoglucomutase|nr:beta-phosphoglucomutase [Bacteroidota bacterium]
MTFKGCLFDLDGVIVDTASHHFVAWKTLAEELGVAFDEEDNEQLKGVSRVDSLEFILQKGNLVLDSNTKLRLMDKKNLHYLGLADQIQPADALPGIVDLIADLKAAGVRIGLGSSSKNAEQILSKLNLLAVFDAIVDGNHLTLSKPDPEVFLKGAHALGLAPEDCLVIEDAIAGVDAGIAGGFQVLGVGDANELKRAHAVVPGFGGLNWDEIQNLLLHK